LAPENHYIWLARVMIASKSLKLGYFLKTKIAFDNIKTTTEKLGSEVKEAYDVASRPGTVGSLKGLILCVLLVSVLVCADARAAPAVMVMDA
jgi:hypothetical protein